MAVALPAGTIVQAKIGGADLINPFSAPLRSRFADALANQGARLELLSYSDERGYALGFTTEYTITVDVRTLIARASADEVVQVLAFAAYLATGYNVTEAAATRVNRTATGDPAPGAPQGIGVPDVLAPFAAIWDGLRQLLTAAPWVIFAVVAIALLALFLVARESPKLVKVFA